MLLNKLFKDFPELETDRLVLKELTQSNTQDLYEIFSDPEVMKYYNMKPIQSVDEIKGLIADTRKSYEDSKAIRWGIHLKETDKLIGTCGFQNIEEESKKFEIGFELSRSYWGQGIMKEAVGQILTFGFEQVKVNRVEALVESENSASQKLLTKLNFNREGLLRDYKFNKGQFIDMIMYALLKTEF